MPRDFPIRFENERLLWTIENVYTEDECRDFIRRIESASPTLATNNPLYRDQDRVILDDLVVANDLFHRLAPNLPARLGAFGLERLNERLRMYRYRPGQRFEPHMDHWYRPDPFTVTLLTVLVYFNSDFSGGETKFQEQVECIVTPKPGLVAVFQHKIRHEGCPVTTGTKYAMRSDVIYRSPDEPVGTAG